MRPATPGASHSDPRLSTEPAYSLAQIDDPENVVHRGLGTELREKVGSNFSVVERCSAGGIDQGVYIADRGDELLSIGQERRSPGRVDRDAICNVSAHESTRNGIENSVNSIEYAVDRFEGGGS